jgi:8-oxo-dGTP pyrophosphatase MutT (NUDIX family)
VSLVRDAVRGTRYRPLPGEHVVAARAVKDAARSAAGALMATHTAEDISTGHVDLAAVAAAASGSFAPRTTLTPDDIAAALIEQGISFSPPLGPGPPIRPYAGYNAPIRTWPYTPGTNIASETRTGRIPFSTLTQIIEGYDIAQICISHIIASMTSMPLLFRAVEGYEGDVSKEIAQAKQFWKKPDGKHPWKVWLTKLVYQQCAYDCAMVYKVKDKGGRLKAVQVPDGRMWAPVVDYWGERPDAPGPAFVQFVQGLPWGWTDETLIVYEPFTARAEDPRYGLSPIECVLLNANTDVRFQFYFLQMFTGGQIPEGFAEAPPDQSDPDALAAWQELWDNFMTGDQSARWGMRWLPFGAKFTPYKPQNFDVAFSEHLERRTIAMFHRTPQDLGLLADVNRATSETQVDQQFRISDLPRTSFIEDVFLNPITQEELGLPVECFFDTGQEKEDRLMVMQEQVGYIKAGVISPDDVREKILGLSVDPDKRIPRFYDAGGRLGVTPLGYIEAISKWFSDWDPTTGAPDLDKIQPREFIVPGELQAPPAGGPTPGARGQLPPGQPGGQAPGQNPPPVAPAPAPTSGGAKPAAGQEPAHDETNVAPAAGSKAPPGTKPAAKQLEQLDVGGLVVKAADSGRVLMIQRALQPGDPAAGTFEFPGGHMEGGETAMQAAVREWQEEVGVPLPDGYFDGSWTSPNGIYRGFVYVIASEDLVHLNPDPENRGVLNPDDPDQDLIEVVCWLDPVELPSMPNLRDECHTSDWVVIAQAGKLAKCDAGPTAGITAETGLQGVNLTGFNDDDEDEADAEEALQKALSQWRTNALLALRFGRTPKYFTDACIPVELGHRIYKSLAKMKTKEQVQTFFKAVKADPKGSRWQGSGLRRRIPEAYAPKIAQALREGTKGIDAAVASMVTRASKASPATPTPSGPNAARDARAAVEANVSIDAARANAVFAQMYADAYAGGTKAARDALGVDARAPSWLSDDMLTSVSRDWETWTPGWGDAALKDAGGGLKTLLDARGITIQGISDSAMDRIGTALADGIAAGDPPATIASAMSDVIADPDRAFMIADTETARAMTSASIDTYQENGVEQVDLLTFEPCDECEELEDANPYDLDDAPDVPIHPQCFPAGTITAGPRVVGSVERWYDGELVEIVTALGDELSVTPNHPVLTDKGWVAAGLLNVGSNVIRCPAVERVVAIHPDDYHGPALIEDVAETLGGAFRVVARSVPVATVDFHSDGGGSDVCVVRTDGLLGNDAVHATVAEPLGHREFEFACHMADTFDAERLVGQTSVGELRPSDRVVGSLSPLAPFIGSGTGHADEHGSRAVAGSDSSVGEPPPDAVAVDTEGTRQRKFALAGKVAAHDGGDVQVSKLRAGPKPVPSEDSVDARFPDADNGRNLIGSLAGLVESDRVIDLRRVKWSGHVYNLETESGWYMANSLVVHNCRCALAPSNIPGAPSAEEGE